jgi:hypothetical protein
MTHHFDELAAHPPVDGLAPREREYLAYELTVVGRAARERADLLKATGHRGVELAVVELTEFAGRVLARAHRYQHPEGSPRP